MDSAFSTDLFFIFVALSLYWSLGSKYFFFKLVYFSKQLNPLTDMSYIVIDLYMILSSFRSLIHTMWFPQRTIYN